MARAGSLGGSMSVVVLSFEIQRRFDFRAIVISAELPGLLE